MKLRNVFLANVSSFSVLIGLGIWGSLIDSARANAAVQAYPLKFGVWALFWTFFGSLFWLYVQSWVMLFRGWKKRAARENTNLFLILLFLNIPASYWFYSRRYAIDPSSP
jgi:hypothetical protein